VRCITVEAANWWVSASRALLADREAAWVVLSCMRFGADSTAGRVLTEGCWVAIALAVAALGATAIGNIVGKLAFPVADGKVMSANISLLGVAGQSHDNSGVCLVLTAVCRGEPPWRLSLHKLRVIGRNAI
jgi:hypothetical protein